MSNKFKIRNLENEKRRIDKLIAKLRREDEERVNNKFIGVIKEVRRSTICNSTIEREVVQTFEYSFLRRGNEIECHVKDGTSNIIGIGISKCHNDDMFNENIGCTIAERRAIVDYYKKIERAETGRYN